MPVEMNFRQVQNIYLLIAKTAFREVLADAKNGSDTASKWVTDFKTLGEMLLFNLSAVLGVD
jgi:hypothetical protein